MRLDIIGFPMLTLKQGPFPLHPGAIKLYRGLGLEVPSHLVPWDASSGLKGMKRELEKAKSTIET